MREAELRVRVDVYRKRQAESSRAVFAVAFEQHLADIGDVGPFFFLRRRDLHIAQTGDQTAGDANEVGMFAVALISFAAQFKPPSVVAQLGARNDARFGQINQVAVDRGFVKALRH